MGKHHANDKNITLVSPLIPARPQDKPKTVTTVEEYEALPVGSIVTESAQYPYTKSVGNRWHRATSEVGVNDRELAGTTRTVLREGRGG